jgi:hypothetical protein
MKYLVAISALFIIMAFAPAANAAACAGGVYRAACVAGAYDYVVVRRGHPVVVHRRAVVSPPGYGRIRPAVIYR